MVAFIPSKTLEFDTKLTPQELVSALSNSITSLEWSKRAAKPFMGLVDKKGFIVMRALYVKTGSLPVAYGRFLEINGQTRLRIMISFPFFTALSGAFLLVTLGIFLPALGVLFRLGMLLGVSLGLLSVIALYILVLVLFNSESEKLAKFLADLLS